MLPGIIRMTMRLKLYTLLCASFLFLFTSCNQDDDPVPPEAGSKTVLVYIVADKNGLESSYPSNFATQDIDEMLVGMKSIDTSLYNLLVYLDDNGDSPILFRIAKDKKGNVERQIVKKYAEQVSTDVDVMKEVMHRTFYEYPADSYGLVYWSHADGWIPYPVPSASTRWIGQDAGEGQDNRMNISDFVEVLDDEMPHFDFIMFDACFMMSIEVAYAVRNYTDYYMGCPTENPGPGAPYDKVVPLMFKQGAAVQMAEAYFNHYNENYKAGVGISNANWTGGTSVAVLKTSELDNLAILTNQVLQTDVTLEELRANIFDYDKRISKGHIGYFDMQGIIQYLTSDVEYKMWKKAFNSALVYWNTTEKKYSAFADYRFDAVAGMFSMKETNGVTHYIPLSLDSQAAAAYRSTAWYTAAGLDKMGW